jgi:predicted Co/Zn/Cd cation transporter (cation efflux family)
MRAGSGIILFGLLMVFSMTIYLAGIDLSISAILAGFALLAVNLLTSRYNRPKGHIRSAT